MTDFFTYAPVILRTDRIIEVAETKMCGTYVATEYGNRPSVYVREPALDVYWKWHQSREDATNERRCNF